MGLGKSLTEDLEGRSKCRRRTEAKGWRQSTDPNSGSCCCCCRGDCHCSTDGMAVVTMRHSGWTRGLLAALTDELDPPLVGIDPGAGFFMASSAWAAHHLVVIVMIPISLITGGTAGGDVRRGAVPAGRCRSCGAWEAAGSRPQRGGRLAAPSRHEWNNVPLTNWSTRCISIRSPANDRRCRGWSSSSNSACDEAHALRLNGDPWPANEPTVGNPGTQTWTARC